ncbi:MAG TPA: low molecular weight protein arginine phosphatase [Elusimicrobiota bacterium]|nr:low molecular weight protein arginine phosphatase [Elusimicrobiota bacterium]
MTASKPRRILFVCTGNICRSAMAEHLLRHLAAQRGLALEAASAGIAAEPHYRVPEPAKRLLAAAGVPPFEHKARLATREVLRWADTILVMAGEHHDYVVDLYPEFTSRTRLFREAAGFGDQDVEDPMAQSDEVFARCFGVIRESLDALLRADFR